MEKIILKALKKKGLILFFLYIFLIILILTIIIIRFAEIEIHIKNLKYSSKKNSNGHINKECKIIISINVLEKIKLLKVDLSRFKESKTKNKNRIR